MNIYWNLAKVQQELKATKDLFNKFGGYNYRSCESILEAVKPLLAKHELALTLTDEIVCIGDRIYVKATASVFPTGDNDGEICVSVDAFAREEEAKKGMDASQVTGAASSYARKYALNGLFCIDDNKDSDATNTHGKDAEDQNQPKQSPKAAPSEANLFKCEECGRKLETYVGSNGKTVSLRAHAERSQALFKKVLCLDCINKLNACADS